MGNYCNGCGTESGGGRFCQSCGFEAPPQRQAQPQRAVPPLRREAPPRQDMPHQRTSTGEGFMATERVQEKKVVFSVALLFFWIKGFISVDRHVIKVSRVNTILGFIPAGRDEQTFALRNVQGSSTSSSYKAGRFVSGALMAIVGFTLFEASVLLALVLIFFGVVIFLGGMLTSITIDGNGSRYRIEVPFFEKQKIAEINQEIHNAVIYREDKEVHATYGAAAASAAAIVNGLNPYNQDGRY